MSQRTAQRRQQAIDQYLADDKVEDICRQLVCSKSWLYKWRDRSDAHHLAWVQARSTRPPGHRVPARDITPQRHRRWRYGHHARARPARDRAHALTTNHLSYCTPPSQGGEITRVQFIHVCIPGVTGFLIRQTLSTLDVCCSSPEPEPHWRTCDRSSSL